MIDRNLKYKEETYNIKGVVNLIVLFAAISIFFIRDVPIKTIVITIVIISILVGTIEYVITENKRKKYQSLIKTYGCYCISGIIKDHYKNIFQNRAGFTKTRYYIIVEYEDPYTNELQQYTTPALNFNPEKDLGSFQCKLYIKEDQIYVTNFVKRGINHERIIRNSK